MGNVTLSPSELLTVIAGAAALVTGIWHAAMHIGRLSVKVERHSDKIRNLDERIDACDQELRFLKGLK